MAIDKIHDWRPAPKFMVDMVRVGQRLTWRKSYNDTKDKTGVNIFNYTANIYEVRIPEEYIYLTNKYEYMDFRILGKYHLHKGLDGLCADLFDLSLAYKLVALDAEYLEIVVEKSKDGSTNIDDEVMEAMMDIQKKVAKQLRKKGVEI